MFHEIGNLNHNYIFHTERKESNQQKMKVTLMICQLFFFLRKICQLDCDSLLAWTLYLCHVLINNKFGDFCCIGSCTV